MTSRTTRCGWPPGPGRAADDHNGDAPAADADRPAVLRADHRVGLARRPGPQPGHRLGHPQETRAAAEVPRRPRRGPADDRGPGQQRSPRPARRRAAGPHRHAGRRARRPGSRRRRADRRRATGCGSRSASSATTATCRCTPSSSRSWPTGPPPTSSTSAATSGWSPTTADRWTGTSSAASSPASAAPPACPACTRTGCGTPWPPRPSTAACGWRPSPRCSATARWR